jgi:hypothetical protein
MSGDTYGISHQEIEGTLASLVALLRSFYAISRDSKGRTHESIGGLQGADGAIEIGVEAFAK